MHSAGSAKNLCGKGLTCWISLRNISPTFKTLKLQIWGIQRPSKCKKLHLRENFMEMSQAIFRHKSSQISFPNPISTGLLDLIHYWVVLRNPKTVLCRPLGFNYHKILFFWMLFKMSPLRIAQKYPFWAHSGDLLKMLVLKKPGHVIYHRKENLIRISEMCKTSF